MTEQPQRFAAEHHAPVPIWRDVRVLRWLFQFAVLGLVVALILVLARNLQDSLRSLGLNLSFDFLGARAGFPISEGPLFDPNQTMWKAYTVGVANTLRASAIGIVLATIVGTLIGIARLSTNWLVSRLALIYVEVIQNTPLLVQLFFWFVLIRALPSQRAGELISIPPGPIRLGAAEIPPLAYLSQRAAALPGIVTADSFSTFWPFMLAAVVIALVAGRLWTAYKERQGVPPTGQALIGTAALLVTLVIGWAIAPGAPVRIEIPVLVPAGPNMNYLGGWQLSNSFQALLIGLVIYTGAFIAEVVRAGIQAVSYGQIEAATSLGLTQSQRLRLIILPQALRVIVPPLINQYLNLAKNSSLAIAVGYPDLYNVSQTIGNQTGQNIQIVMLMMGTYLLMSLAISVLMNFVNKRTQIVER